MWTDEMLLTLDSLWKEGIKAREIGVRIGKTKNAVIGMARRRNSCFRRDPKKHYETRKTRPLSRKARMEKKLEMKSRKAFTFRYDGGGIPIEKLTFWSCRWPTETARFCGKPKVCRSYCTEHYERSVDHAER